MKPTLVCITLFVSAMVLPACSENTPGGDPCSVTLNDVKFSRSLNNAINLISPEGTGKLSMHCEPKTDFFNEPDGSAKYGNAPVLLTSVDNHKAFTFSAKVTPDFSTTYDAGALYIYINGDLWQKFAFEMDEGTLTRIVTVRTSGTSDDNNHDALAEKTVYMKISSDTRSVGFYYSTDNTKWQLVRVYKNDYPSTIWIGISSQSPLGNGISTLFEDCQMTGEAVKNFRTGI